MQCNFVFLTHSMFSKGNKRTPDVSFGETERKIHRDPAGNPSREILTTSRTLLPLSHCTHSREAEVKSAYNSQARGLSRLQLSFSLSPLGTLPTPGPSDSSRSEEE